MFKPLDADDPALSPPTYNHLKAGLVRVTLPLAPNLDVIDAAGNVVTNAARTVSVWRAVPSIENSSYTAPYQHDGREATLESQALGALRAHSAVSKDPPDSHLSQIAAFERTVFSSPAAEAIAAGAEPEDVEPVFPEGSDEAAGQALFQQACAPCHGGRTGNLITNPAIHDQLFPVLNADGSVNINILPDGTIVPAAVRHDVADHADVNIGISFGSFLGQVGALPNFTGVDFPQLRLRFYTDASRTHVLMDLPPPPPALGPTGGPQAFSTDPGRALVTGDIADWEAFEIPQLRGAAFTAPYFHDNSAPDLRALLDIYSRFILSAVPQLGLPLAFPPEAPGFPPEALSVTQKTQIVAYMQHL